MNDTQVSTISLHGKDSPTEYINAYSFDHSDGVLTNRALDYIKIKKPGPRIANAIHGSGSNGSGSRGRLGTYHP